MSAVTLVAEALLLALLGFTLRELGWRGVPLFGLFSALLLLSHGVEALRTLLPAFVVFWDTGLSDSLSAALKITGIGLVTQTGGMILSDSGNASLARGLQLLGTSVILYLSVPVFETLIELMQHILGAL